MKHFKNLLESLPAKTVVFAFGRFNPPTTGHELLVKFVKKLAKASNADHVIYASATQDKKKNPLSVDKKVHYLNLMFPGTNFAAAGGTERTFIEAAKHLNKKYRNLIMVAGSDRVADYDRLLNKQNGIDFNFDSIKVMSAGERDADSDDASGMSASKMRAAASKGEYATFKKGLPSTLRDIDGKRLMNDVRQGLGLEYIKENIKFQPNALREAYLAKQIFNIGDVVEAAGNRFEIVDRGSNYLTVVDGEGQTHRKWLHECAVANAVVEDVQPGYAPDQISFKGFTTKNLHHSADAAKAFQETIERYGKLEPATILAALKATDAYMKINDMHLEQGEPPDESDLAVWREAHQKARDSLNRIGEFIHHQDYWHMHEHEIQDMEANYNPETAGAEMADSYTPEGNMVQEDFTKMSTPDIKKWINTRQRNAMGGNLSKQRRDQHDQAQAELKKREVNERDLDEVFKPGSNSTHKVTVHYRTRWSNSPLTKHYNVEKDTSDEEITRNHHKLFGGTIDKIEHHNGVNEELTNKTIKSSDKIKVARVIADMLGVENAETLSPEVAVNTGLRKIKNKRMTPEMLGVVKKMLTLAQEVGIKVDAALIPKTVSEETQLDEASFAGAMKSAIAAHERGDHSRAKYHLDNAKTARYALKSTEITKHKDLLDKYSELRKLHEDVVNKNSTYNAAKDILRYKDFAKLKKMNGESAEVLDVEDDDGVEVAANKVGHTLHAHEPDNDSVRRMKVAYKTESFTVKDPDGKVVHTAYSQGAAKKKASELSAETGKEHTTDYDREATVKEDMASADFKTNPDTGRKYRARKIEFANSGMKDKLDPDQVKEEVEEDDFSEDDLEAMANGVTDPEHVLDAYEDDELVIIDADSGEEIDNMTEEVEQLDEVLSRIERMKAKIRFARTAAKRERRVQVALRTRSSSTKINARARRLAVNMMKQRIIRKPVAQMSVQEKERAEAIIARRKEAVGRLAMKLAPRVRKIENDRLSHSKVTK